MKTKTRVLSLIMTVAMILSSLVIVIPASAEESTEITPDGNLWTDYVATSFAGGAGTEASPYQIATAAQLAYLAKLCNEQATDTTNNGGAKYSTLYYELTGPIDARAHQWVAIGNVNDNNRAFQGHFDGNGFTVKTALTDITSVEATKTYFSTAKAHGALFGRISNATIYDLNAEISYVWDQRPTATISTTTCMGLFAWSIYDASKLTNVHLTLDITGTVGTDKQPLGGFGGYVNAADGILKNCSVGGTVTVTNTKQIEFSPYFAIVSGGNKTGITVEDCANYTSIELLKNGHQNFLGGIFCRNWSAADMIVTVKNFIDAGKIKTPKAGNTYLHYGSITGKNVSTSTATVNAQGILSMLDLDFTTRLAGQAHNSGFANLIGSGVFKAHATNTFVVKNCFTTRPLLPDVHLQANSIKVMDADDTTATALETGVTTATSGSDKSFDLKGVIGARLGEYEVSEDGTKTTLTIPKALFEIFKGNGAVVVALGEATATSYTTDEDGNYVFELASVEGIGSMTVTLGNGKEITLNDMWTSSVTPFDVTTTTEDNPYRITTAEELAYLSAASNYRLVLNESGAKSFLVNTKRYFILGNDIDLRFREWTAIGGYGSASAWDADMRANVYLNGNNKTIQGLTITDVCEPNMPAALFGATKSSSKIWDLKLTGSINRTDANADGDHTGTAMLIAFASGPSYVKNVDVVGDMTVRTNKESIVGGIVAFGNNVYIEDSSMDGTVKVVSSAGVPVAGGILGVNKGYGGIERCINKADVILEACTTTNSMAGGIVGKTISDVKSSTSGSGDSAVYVGFYVKNCTNVGDIAITKGADGGEPGSQRIGGIIGNTGRGGKDGKIEVTNCINFGTFSTTKAGNVAEIVGTNEIIAAPGLTVFGFFSPFAATQDVAMLYATAAYNGDETKPAYYNDEAVTKGGKQLANGVESYFEVGVKDTTVSVSKAALDLFLAAGFTMKLTYNNETVATDLTAATATATTYTWVITPVEGADAELVVENAGFTYAANDPTWAGLYVAEKFDDAEGTLNGTVDAPYMITTAGELGLIARLFNDSNTRSQVNAIVVTLATDIDLAGAEWMPIGLSHNVNFVGQINGNGKKISNMTLTADQYAYGQSFIGRASGDFAITDVTFESPVIGATAHNEGATIPAAATVVGALYGGKLDKVNVVDLKLDAVPNVDDLYVGGLIGYANENTITTTVPSEVEGEDDTVTVTIYPSSITNCSVTGTINVTHADSNVKVGGLVARAKSTTIENCANAADITVVVNAEEDNNGSVRVGGIVAAVQTDKLENVATLNNNTNTGDIDVTLTKSHGFAGVAGIVGAAHSTGDVGTLNMAGNFNSGAITLTAPEAVVPVEGEGEGEETPAVMVKGVAAILGYNALPATTLANNYSLAADLPIVGAVVTDLTGDTDNKAFDVKAGIGTVAGAQVRIDLEDATNSGMRFDSYINSTLYAGLLAAGFEVELGTILAPTEILANGVDAEGVAKVIYNPELYTEYTESGFLKVDETDSYFSAAITNIQDNTRDFSAVAYVIVTVNGVDYTYYADFNTDNAANFAEVLDEAIWESSTEETEEFKYQIFPGTYSRYSIDQWNAMNELYNA